MKKFELKFQVEKKSNFLVTSDEKLVSIIGVK